MPENRPGAKVFKVNATFYFESYTEELAKREILNLLGRYFNGVPTIHTLEEFHGQVRHSGN